MTYAFQNPSQDTIFDFLKEAKIIAVVGLSNREETAAYRVSRIMQDAGYRIIPVNPRSAGETILGETVYASLKDIPLSTARTLAGNFGPHAGFGVDRQK